MDSESPSAYPKKEELEARAASGDPVARMTLSGRARQIETGGAVLTPEGSPIARRGRRMSASVLRLAKRLGRSPDEIAQEIPDDTLRRTKYAVVEDPQKDGSILFKHNPVK